MEPDVHNPVYKSPPCVPTVCQINLAHATPHLRYILILSPNLWLCLPSHLFPLGFATKTLYEPLSPHATSTNHLLYFITQISGEYKSLKLIM
jgi:hypothetical protein